MNYKEIKVVDCLDKYYIDKQEAILNDGKLIGFQQEEIPTQTANPSEDE